ncbi:hypothetical protein EVAR_71468_1 [Eumeta japonica]|uniref:Uncharacterized protein n=1 Tax=Eumeta variegata TaxID=151549 RepID=A0A4C1TF88_EUMVA|nr:hypothetical protein EVAR_71468_1 [Eumeta japonica]
MRNTRNPVNRERKRRRKSSPRGLADILLQAVNPLSRVARRSIAPVLAVRLGGRRSRAPGRRCQCGARRLWRVGRPKGNTATRNSRGYAPIYAMLSMSNSR